MEETKKVFLTKTVLYDGKHHQPGSDHEWPADIVDELIDKGAGEPVMDVMAGVNAEQDARRMEELLWAASKAEEEGKITGTGAPTVAAMEEPLGYGVTGSERDEAWAVILKEREADA